MITEKSLSSSDIIGENTNNNSKALSTSERIVEKEPKISPAPEEDKKAAGFNPLLNVVILAIPEIAKIPATEARSSAINRT